MADENQNKTHWNNYIKLPWGSVYKFAGNTNPVFDSIIQWWWWLECGRMISKGLIVHPNTADIVQKLALCPSLSWVSFVFIKNFIHLLISIHPLSVSDSNFACFAVLSFWKKTHYKGDFMISLQLGIGHLNPNSSLQTLGSHFLWGHLKRTPIFGIWVQKIVPWPSTHDLIQLLSCVCEPRFYRRIFWKKEKQEEKSKSEACVGGAIRVLKER